MIRFWSSKPFNPKHDFTSQISINICLKPNSVCKLNVKSLNSCQTIVRHKSVYFHAIVQAICSHFSKMLVVTNILTNILLPILNIWSYISESISLQKCKQTAGIFFNMFVHKYLLPKSKKRSFKKRGNVH
jgi:hypothetical protein